MVARVRWFVRSTQYDVTQWIRLVRRTSAAG